MRTRIWEDSLRGYEATKEQVAEKMRLLDADLEELKQKYLSRPSEQVGISFDQWCCTYGSKCVQAGIASCERGCRPEWCPLVEK